MTASPVFIHGEEIARRDNRQRRGENKRRGGGRRREGGGGNEPRLVESRVNLSKVKLFPLGVQAVAAVGATFTNEATSQNPFEPLRGVVQASVSLDDVELTQLDVGNVSQLTVKNRRFPGQMFSSAADDVLCDLDIVPSGNDFSMEGVSQSIQRVTIGWYGNYFMSVNIVSRK